MAIRPLTQSDYLNLLAVDKKVYPTDNPVTEEILGQWYKNNPEFGVVFEEHNTLRGMLISIPLTKGAWQGLTSGKISEAELHGGAIFNASRDSEIGIHVYHVERHDKSKGFYKEALGALAEIVRNLKHKNLALKVVGFSALCSSLQGRNLFENKLNFRERGFISGECIVRKARRVEIFRSHSEAELKKKLAQGYEFINRCKMLVLYPDEPSLVWSYLK